MNHAQFRVITGLMLTLTLWMAAMGLVVMSEVLGAMGLLFEDFALKFASVALLSIFMGAVKEGYNRAFWQLLGAFNGKPLEHYLDKLERSEPETLEDLRSENA